jgi:hypothetical protein
MLLVAPDAPASLQRAMRPFQAKRRPRNCREAAWRRRCGPAQGHCPTLDFRRGVREDCGVSLFVSEPCHPYRYRRIFFGTTRSQGWALKMAANGYERYLCMSRPDHSCRSVLTRPTKWHGRGRRFDPDQVHQSTHNTVTALLPTTACNVPARCAFIQLDKVCSTTPRLPAPGATLCPDSTSRIASCLSSSVQRPRFPFRIFASLRQAVR